MKHYLLPLLFLLPYLGYGQSEKKLIINSYQELTAILDVIFDDSDPQLISMNDEYFDPWSFVVYINDIDSTKSVFLNDTLQIQQSLIDGEYFIICLSELESCYVLTNGFFLGLVIAPEIDPDKFELINDLHPDFVKARQSFDLVISDIEKEIVENELLIEIKN